MISFNTPVVYWDKENIFSSGKLPCLASKKRLQRVGGLDGIRRQLANIGCQVLITLLAVKDCTEARWSALSPHEILDHLDLGPFYVKSSQSFVFRFFQVRKVFWFPHRNNLKKIEVLL